MDNEKTATPDKEVTAQGSCPDDQLQDTNPEPGNPRQVGYLTLIRAVRDVEGMPPTRKLVLVITGSFLDARTGRGFASRAQIATAAGLSASTVQEHLNALRAAGWLERVHRGSGTTKTASTHQLTVPAKYGPPDKAKSDQPDKAPVAKSDPGRGKVRPEPLLSPAHRSPCDPSVFRTPVEGTQRIEDDPKPSGEPPGYGSGDVELVTVELGCGSDEATAFVEAKWAECRNKAKWSGFLAKGIEYAKKNAKKIEQQQPTTGTAIAIF